MIPIIKKTVGLFFLFCLIGIGNLPAQVKFTATFSPATITKNETTTLRLMIENGKSVTHLIPPSFKDFIVVSGPNQETGMENNNGVTRQYIAVTYALKPKRKGKILLASAAVSVDGTLMHSNAASLQVSNTAASNLPNNNKPFNGFSFFEDPKPSANINDFVIRKAENLQAKIEKNIFLKITTDKTSCYIGEPIVVSYKLYTRLKSESNITKNPYLNGFSVIDLVQPGNTTYGVENIKGRTYNVYTLRKSQLYPLQAGQSEIETCEVENSIHFIKEAYLKNNHALAADLLMDWENNGLPPEALQEEKVTLQTKPVLVNIKALPIGNKPISFSGAVGNFSLEAMVDKNNFTTSDAGKLTLTITGQGNMELINAPEVNWPEGVEANEPTTTASLNKLAVPVSGSKVFTYLFTVKKAASYTIPAIDYSYFNPGQEKYITLSVQPINLLVQKGAGKLPNLQTGSTATDAPSMVDFIFTHRLWLVVLVVLLIFTGLFFWLNKTSKAVIKNKIDTAENLPKSSVVEMVLPEKPYPLAATQSRLLQEDARGFYTSLNKELRSFLAIQLAVEEAEINKKTIAAQLDNKGIPKAIGIQTQQLLEEVEWQLYTPFSDENKMDLLYKTACGVVAAF